ncbi:MAG TPA: YtxH domain-containing protein [Anaeromyxobacteraceae bacterium]|nr:YtxH domain-containing protein [Anaeromyxobacteraceae bacterium]
MSDGEPTRSGTSGLAILVAFLGGALAGVVATMLLAPRPGAETRRRFADAANRSKDTVERLRTAAEEAAAAARAAFKNAMREDPTLGEEPASNEESGPNH